MQTSNAVEWREAEALQRYTLITPLLDPTADKHKVIDLRKKLAAQYGVSERTIYRYEQAYRSNGFSGLKPTERKGSHPKTMPSNFDDLVAEAIQLKKEVPTRSVEAIILILELEGRAAPGVLKRSTLERYLYRAGLGNRQMKVLKEAQQSSSRRFCMPHRMMLIQGDIKYGPRVYPDSSSKTKVKTYLSSAIDDHSRYILYSRFYIGQEETIVEDTFHHAILQYGKFDACYFDNGKQYVAKQLKLSLAKLGIRIRHAKVRSGKSKGKIEKFHQIVDAFLAEASIDKSIKTLEDLNHSWQIYLEEYYQISPHDGIREYYKNKGVQLPTSGISPTQEFNRDSRALSYIDTSVVAEAFMHHEKRRVDKGSVIKFDGKQYEVNSSLIGCIVDVSYDPFARDIITVSYEGMAPFQARPLQINQYCPPSPSLPVSLTPVPESSRLLDALRKKHQETRKHRTDALSFADYVKGGDSDV